MKHTYSLILFLCIALLACQSKPDKAYTLSKEIEANLIAFEVKDKFSAESWDQRGLIPSSQDVEDRMN